MSTKVFVGNLSFKTKPETLKAQFEAAGKVVEANIITRGPRSLGYGFVEFATDEEAVKSVELLNRKEIDGRPVNVEVARPRQATQEDSAAATSTSQGQPQQNARPRRQPQQRQQQQQQPQADNADGQNPAGFQQRRYFNKQGGGQRAYRPRFNNNGQPSEQHQEGGAATNDQGAKVPRGRGQANFNQQKPGFSQRRSFRQQQQNNNNAENVNVAVPQQPNNSRPAGQRPFQKRPSNRPQNRPPVERKPSDTTLFVANLPFAVDDAELAEIFSNLNLSKAHVVKKRNGRSKGFGFVEFATKEDQQKALTEKDQLSYKNRTLNVKVALVAANGQVIVEGEEKVEHQAPDVPASAEEKTEQAQTADASPKKEEVASA